MSRELYSPQYISGASQQNSVTAFSLTTEEDVDLFYYYKKKKNINVYI